MFWLERVPSYAAVNESVEICKRRGFAPQAKFVNAVLRSYSREAEATRQKLAELRDTNLALAFSHPEWLCRRWEERLGKADTMALLEWNNSPPPTYARINSLKTSGEKLRQIWTAEGVEFEAKKFDWVPEDSVFEIRRHPPISSLKSFADGLFYIQDPSTLLAAQLLGPKPGEAILDLCAAPGGKTTYIAALLNNRGRILAQDLEPSRLKMVSENALRMGADSITTDSAKFPSDTAFDRILVDAPCSNTGVTRRRIELRWRITPEEIERLAKTQLSLLKQAARRLRLGGTIVYSTCSLEREENQAVIREFLTVHSKFKMEVERNLSPVRDRVDGAYCALLTQVP
jgi:16S rRNA (cytosine967-C5)-methyltransferase